MNINPSKHIILIILLVIIVYFLISLYINRYSNSILAHESFVSNPTSTSTTNVVLFTNNIEMSNVVKIIDNINVNGRYVNVFQCQPVTVPNGDTYNPMGHYLKIADSPMVELSDNEKRVACLNLLVKGGVEPIDYVMLWTSQYVEKPPQQDFSIWRPIPPRGYVSMCDVCVIGFSKPSHVTCPIVCIPSNIVEKSPILKDLLIKVKYNSLNMDYTLQCWNTSSHNFFRCENTTASHINTHDQTQPLVIGRQQLLNNIYNIKTEKLNAKHIKNV